MQKRRVSKAVSTMVWLPFGMATVLFLGYYMFVQIHIKDKDPVKLPQIPEETQKRYEAQLSRDATKKEPRTRP